MLSERWNFLGQEIDHEPGIYMPADPPWWWLTAEVEIEKIEPSGIRDGRMVIWGIEVEYIILDKFHIVNNNYTDYEIPGVSEDAAINRILYALNSEYSSSIEKVQRALIDAGMLVMPGGSIINHQALLTYQFSGVLPDGTPLLVLFFEDEQVLVEADFFEETTLLVAVSPIKTSGPRMKERLVSLLGQHLAGKHFVCDIQYFVLDAGAYQ